MKFLLALFLFVVGAAFFAANLSLGVFGDLLSQLKEQEVFQDILKRQAATDFSLQEPEKEVSSPPLLRIFQPVSSTSLSTTGVLQWTNAHRQAAGLGLLQGNFVLDQIAERKAQDMFERQYFAHVSPAGTAVDDLAQDIGYEFIAIGENLALGNYASDEALVQAWMESPGHRENILGTRYEEIGIAVQEGLFEGNSTWLAVQVFGLSLSGCDFPNERLKEKIDLGKAQIEELDATLERERAELAEYHPKAGPRYKRRVQEYNTFVDQYNALSEEIQANIARYNIEVQAFNECIK